MIQRVIDRQARFAAIAVRPALLANLGPDTCQPSLPRYAVGQQFSFPSRRWACGQTLCHPIKQPSRRSEALPLNVNNQGSTTKVTSLPHRTAWIKPNNRPAQLLLRYLTDERQVICQGRSTFEGLSPPYGSSYHRTKDEERSPFAPCFLTTKHPTN